MLLGHTLPATPLSIFAHVILFTYLRSLNSSSSSCLSLCASILKPLVWRSVSIDQRAISWSYVGYEVRFHQRKPTHKKRIFETKQQKAKDCKKKKEKHPFFFHIKHSLPVRNTEKNLAKAKTCYFSFKWLFYDDVKQSKLMFGWY